MDVESVGKSPSRKSKRDKLKDKATKLKRLARYLVEFPRLVFRFVDGESAGADVLDIFFDSDWAGDRRSRKSTSGGVLMLGNHCINTWSASQQAYALSSAEAEFYAMIEGVTRAKGLLSLARKCTVLCVSFPCCSKLFEPSR